MKEFKKYDIKYPPIKVAIGVCTYNGSKKLRRLLDSLLKLNYPQYLVIVIDNNSTDDTSSIVHDYPSIIYAKEEKQGLAYARNKLLDVCPADVKFLGILDDDETVNPDWINNMLFCFSLNEKIVAVGGPYVPIYEVCKPKWMPDNFFSYKENIHGVNVYSKLTLAGGNAMINLEIARKRNIKFDVSLGYNEKILLSGEDVDFFDRLITDKDLCGFTEYAHVNHYIDKNKLTFKWILRRFYLEGVTQYFRYGRKELFHNLIQLPLKVFALALSLLSFNIKTIAKRFFKLVMCSGVCSGFMYKK